MSKGKRRAFSLVEMIVIVGIMAIVFSGATLLFAKKVDRDLTFSRELDTAAVRMAVSIYREVFLDEPSMDDLFRTGLLRGSEPKAEIRNGEVVPVE